MLIKKTRANNFMKEVFFKFQSMELTKIGLCNSGTALKILPLKPRQDLRTTTELLRVSSKSSQISNLFYCKLTYLQGPGLIIQVDL